MLLKIALFGILAITVIGGGAVAWILLAAPAATPVAAMPANVPVKVSILVAAHALRGGSLVKPEDLVAQELAQTDVPSGASLDTPMGRSGLIGAMIRRGMAAAQPILPGDVVHPGDHGFLAAVLGPNLRAITVAVDAVSGTAGLIWPGDRVDVILTQTLDDPMIAAGRRVAAETVLSDARVIAVDQQIAQGQAPDVPATQVNRTATLEVTSIQAERVLVAGRLGKLSLSVRAADGSGDNTAAAAASAGPGDRAATPEANATPLPTNPAPTGGVTWAGDVSPALGGGGPRKTPPMVHIFQGSLDSKEFHF